LDNSRLETDRAVVNVPRRRSNRDCGKSFRPRPGELIEIYDQYDYGAEMAAALKKLSALIERISPAVENVVALHK
jgi:hypothetical protein